jgi:protoporphyrinogen oxidase
MRTEKAHTVILGAGPAGLAAGFTLAKAGLNPIVIDRETVPGGLMRSIRHGDFVVDVGRKELYNRLARVDDFWTSVIGPDYRHYPHRGGYLYEGHIFEMSRAYGGFRRGMPWSIFLRCLFDFAWAQITRFAVTPRNVEEYFYRTRGSTLTRIAAQGFQEKLAGVRWADILLSSDATVADDAGVLRTFQEAVTRAFTVKDVNTFRGTWRHPAKGTGQICDALACGITQSGGTLILEAQVRSLETKDGKVRVVVVDRNGEQVRYFLEHLVSSVPLEVMIKLLGRQVPAGHSVTDGSQTRRRTVVLVYLFLDRPPTFLHAWLQVTCPSTRIGRITNYGGFNSDMVPAGKGCLCCEYYCYGSDPLLDVDETELVRATKEYCATSGLIERQSVADSLVLRLPGADASQNRHNWMTSMRLGLFDEIKPFANLYHVGRTDLDIATLAGIDSAEAIMSGDRSTFDRHFDPDEIGIRSERKAFEFKVPAGARIPV